MSGNLNPDQAYCEISEDEWAEDGANPPCTDPAGHKFECTGTQYGGDDPRWNGEGRCLCVHCGADGDA